MDMWMFFIDIVFWAFTVASFGVDNIFRIQFGLECQCVKNLSCMFLYFLEGKLKAWLDL